MCLMTYLLSNSLKETQRKHFLSLRMASKRTAAQADKENDENPLERPAKIAKRKQLTMAEKLVDSSDEEILGKFMVYR